ncbi:condensation domain-containing protein [Micromonospora peucetia]|uniref:condensation domain-containing protein n=1 Tax=Micromonospora peucetia TaxID=47871 RepID=UPI00225017BC|nr:condensation domain-containing protein [Micromonospora peucetia]MCX4386268.1 condensation domain-containing protein [Micromonospora peucetia]
MTIAASRKEAAMWLLERLVPDTGVNNVAVAFEVAGRIDRELFPAALRAVLARHEVLRTVFRSDDATLTREVLAPDRVDVPVLEIPAGDDGRDADLTAFAAEPFVIDGRPLVRAGVHAGADRDVCCVVVHHLNFDAMSTTILLRELLVAYETVAAGRRPDDAPVAALAERTPDERSVAYWRKNLDGLRPAESGLWCARPPVGAPSLRARTVHHELSAPARAVVRRFQRELRASEAVVLLAAYSLLLAQHGAGSDVVIGTPVNVRDQRGMNAIGYHANLVPLRVRLDPEADFRAVVKQTRSTFLEAISHADVPLEQVSPAVLGDAPSSWRSSFFRHLFNYVPGTVDASRTLTGMPVRHVMVENGYSRFDLEFFIMPGEDGTTVRAAFCVDAFDAADVGLLLQRYDALLVRLGDELDRPVAQLSRRGPSDLALPASPPRTAATTSVLDAVHATVAANPDLVAVRDDTDAVTYGQLWSAAVATRDLVAASGGSTVAVLAPRGAQLAAAWLGVWLAGARCVLLDPTQPIPDLAARLADSGAAPVLAAEGLPVPGAARIPAITDEIRTDAPAGPDLDAVAYLAYQPDAPAPLAVTVTHRALADAVARLAERVTTGPAVTSWLSSSATDAALTELLVALTTGGRVVVAPEEARTDGHALGELVRRHGVQVVQAPPAVWREVVEQAGARLAGRAVLVGHEPLPRPLAAQLHATGCTLHHGYTTPGVAGYAALGGGWDGAGVLPAARVFVTEPGTGHELGIGVRGELCVAGDALAAGYHGRPELTAARFGEHPTHGRFHRTGDLARLLPDGQVDVVGPLSAQVRVAGQRIHLRDIESVFAAHPDVEAVAAVGSAVDGPDVTVVVFVESRKPDVADRLREHARAALPLTPELVVLDQLPVTVAGTVDRAALVARAATRALADVDPPDETTVALVGIWTEMLDRPGLHADSNFFASGGHSLLGAQLVQRVRTDLEMPVQLADLFANPTPRQLAEHLQNAFWDDDEDDD